MAWGSGGTGLLAQRAQARAAPRRREVKELGVTSRAETGGGRRGTESSREDPGIEHGRYLLAGGPQARSRRAWASGLPATHGKVSELLHLKSGFGFPPHSHPEAPFSPKINITHVLGCPACAGPCFALWPVHRSHSGGPEQLHPAPPATPSTRCRTTADAPTENIYLFVYLNCGEIHNTTLTILTIFKRSVQQCQVYSQGVQPTRAFPEMERHSDHLLICYQRG